jgi:hypothetical protein
VTALALGPTAELVLAGAAAAVVGLVVFAPYVRAGGYHLDDWSNGAVFHFQGADGLFRWMLSGTPRSPLASVYTAAAYGALGQHEHMHLALAALLHLGVGLLLFGLLRELSLDWVRASACAALAILFPYADSIWLWATAGQLDLSVAFWLLGAILAVRGLRSAEHGGRWHAGALLLYAASVLLYDETLIVVALTGSLYLLRATRRVALRRWALDAGTVGLCFLLFSSQLVNLTGGQDVHVTLGLRATLDHIGMIADEGLTVAIASLVPFGSPGRTAVLVSVLALVAGSGFVAWRTPDAGVRRELVRSLLLALGGAMVAIAGWGMLAPGDPAYYSPGKPALGNRLNLVADIGLPLLVVGLVGLAATLAFAAVPRDRRWATPLLIAVAATGIGGAYLDRIYVDRAAWLESRREQGIVLERLRGLMARPPAGSTVIARGFPLYVGGDVPVFNASWDLDGAVKLLWNDATLRAWPGPPGSLACGGTGMAVTGFGNLGLPALYGHVFVVDVATGRAARIDSAAGCRALGS